MAQNGGYVTVSLARVSQKPVKVGPQSDTNMLGVQAF